MDCNMQNHIAPAWLCAHCVVRANQQRDTRSARDTVESMVHRDRELLLGLNGSGSRAPAHSAALMTHCVVVCSRDLAYAPRL